MLPDLFVSVDFCFGFTEQIAPWLRDKWGLLGETRKIVNAHHSSPNNTPSFCKTSLTVAAGSSQMNSASRACQSRLFA